MNTVHLNRERLKQSRQRITINGESRVAYGRNEISYLTGIKEKVLKEYEELPGFPPSLFLWQEPFFTGVQLTLIYAVHRGTISWSTLREHWTDEDTEQDLWPRPSEEETSRPTGGESEN